MEIRRIAKTMIGPKLNEFIWHVNLDKKHTKKIIKQNFWGEVVLAWSNYTYVHVDKVIDKAMIHVQPLWLNTSIRINNNVLFNSEAIQVGMTRVQDIVTNTGIFLSYLEMRAKFGNKLDFLEYYNICKAIPVQWKRILRNVEPRREVSVNFLEDYLCQEKSSQYIYNKLVVDEYGLEEKRKM